MKVSISIILLFIFLGISFEISPQTKVMDSTLTSRNLSLDDSPLYKVLYGKYAGTEIKYGGEDYLIVREDDILAKLED